MYQRRKDILVIGFALFAVFFGAGNLIFPPLIGVVSGNSWPAAIMGLAISGIVFPIATIIAVDHMGGEFKGLCAPVSRWFYRAYMFFFVIFILTCGIPRQGGVGIETGFFSLFPALQGSKIALVVGLLIYYGLVLFFSTRPSSVVDMIGKYLTPFLVVILAIIVISSIIWPIGIPMDTGIQGAFSYAFLQGYQTGDVAVGIVIAGTFIQAIRAKGYDNAHERQKAVRAAASIALLGLLFVYGGLLYIGATGSGLFSPKMDQTALLVSLIETSIGHIGTSVLGIGILLACLTTTIGVITTISELTVELSHGWMRYRTCIIVYDMLGFLLATSGVATIIKYTYPVFVLIYPMAIVLTILGCFSSYIPNHGAWKGAVAMAAVIGMYEAFSVMNSSGIIHVHSEYATYMYNLLPLSSVGFAWLLPCMVGFIVGTILIKVRNGKIE